MLTTYLDKQSETIEISIDEDYAKKLSYRMNFSCPRCVARRTLSLSDMFKGEFVAYIDYPKTEVFCPECGQRFLITNVDYFVRPDFGIQERIEG